MIKITQEKFKALPIVDGRRICPTGDYTVKAWQTATGNWYEAGCFSGDYAAAKGRAGNRQDYLAALDFLEAISPND